MRRLCRSITIALCAVLVASCSTERHDFAGDGGTEAEYYSSFVEMLDSVDMALVGTVVKVDFGPNESGLRTARVLVRDERRADPVEVAFLLGQPASAEDTMTDLRAALPKGESVWLLRSIAKYYSGVFIPVNQAAIVEQAPNGRGQPAFYRATAAEVRNGRGSVDADHGDFIRDLNAIEFAAIAERVRRR